MSILRIGLCEVVYLSNNGIKPTETKRFNQPTNEIWMPQVSERFQDICRVLRPQAYHVHCFLQRIGNKHFGYVDFYTNIPAVILERWKQKAKK